MLSGVEKEVIEKPAIRKLIVVDDPIPGKTAGGVQLLIGALLDQSKPDLEVVRATSSEVLDLVRQAADEVDVTIYVQKSGSLSAGYRDLVQEWLSAGAKIVEKNVFARASRFRPVDQNYFMALMSSDGAYRFALRSLFVSPQGPKKYGHLTVPYFSVMRKDGGAETRRSNELVFLRIGRPDPIKWSGFERSFVESLSRSYSGDVRLIRVGFPGVRSFQEEKVGPNLVIQDLPYSSDLSGVYRSADVYLHHSRIGETFGNTLAEAKAAGLPVIMAVELHWDCAGIELLTEGVDVVGTQNYLRRNASIVIDSVLGRSESFAAAPQRQLSPAEFIDLITTDRSRSEQSVPTVLRSILYLLRLTQEVKGSNLGNFIRALITEPVRSIRHSRDFEV
jgi:hypothetical protein